MEAMPEQDALFAIEGEDGCVWACSPDGRDVWCRNLGPKDKVVEVLPQWLSEVDACDRRRAFLTTTWPLPSTP
jgi:hypothetical protein